MLWHLWYWDVCCVCDAHIWCLWCLWRWPQTRDCLSEPKSSHSSTSHCFASFSDQLYWLLNILVTKYIGDKYGSTNIGDQIWYYKYWWPNTLVAKNIGDQIYWQGLPQIPKVGVLSQHPGFVKSAQIQSLSEFKRVTLTNPNLKQFQAAAVWDGVGIGLGLRWDWEVAENYTLLPNGLSPICKMVGVSK